MAVQHRIRPLGVRGLNDQTEGFLSLNIVDVKKIVGALHAELKNEVGMFGDHVALETHPLFPNLEGVLTDAVEGNFTEINNITPEVTVVYGKEERVIDAFATVLDPHFATYTMQDYSGNVVPLRGAIEADQFLAFIARRFPDEEIERITVFRKHPGLAGAAMHYPDSLFVKVALSSYGINDDGELLDQLVLRVLQAHDGRLPRSEVPGGSCQRTGWCIRWRFGQDCIKMLGICNIWD